jgi:hypothetical protein
MIDAGEIADLLGRDVEVGLDSVRRNGGQSAQCIAERKRNAKGGKPG